MRNQRVNLCGCLIHISHYDPTWCGNKATEEPFSADVGKRVVDVMASWGMNLLVVDCADGVRYKSHPELARPYTVAMSALRQLASHAHDCGIDVVPKLNFAKSGRNQHDQWMAPHVDQIRWMSGFDRYWQIAEELIDELVEAAGPRAFFHIGMDEDHYRSLTQYVHAIKTLRRSVARHKLRTVVWNVIAVLKV